MFALSNITNTYLDNSNYNGDKLRHADGHSKILGVSNDGYPIYGPYGYNEPSVSGNVELMKSSYKLKSEFTEDRYNIITVSSGVVTAFDNGTIIEDYEYIQGLGSLDECNGRYCVTPDFPNGTYAYFLTFEDDTNFVPAYPYIIGNKYYSNTNSTSFKNYMISDGNNLSSYSDDEDSNYNWW